MHTARCLSILGLVVFAGACAGAATVADPLRQAAEIPTRFGRVGDAIRRAVALEGHGGKPWVLTPEGALYSVEPDRQLALHLEHEIVVGVRETPGGKLWALSRDRVTDDLRLWAAKPGRVGDASAWEPMASWMGAETPPLALVTVGEAPVVIAPAAVFQLDGDETASVELWSNVGGSGQRVLAAATPAGTAFVADMAYGTAGFLHRIDLETGEVATLECPSSLDLTIEGRPGRRAACARTRSPA